MSIDTRGPEFAQHAVLFALPKTLTGGTQAMRQAGAQADHVWEGHEPRGWIHPARRDVTGV